MMNKFQVINCHRLCSKSFLGQIVDPKSFIKPQYRLDVINSVLNGSPTGPDALLEFLLFTIRDIIAVGIDVVNDIIMPLSEKIVTPEQVCQVQFY